MHACTHGKDGWVSGWKPFGNEWTHEQYCNVPSDILKRGRKARPVPTDATSLDMPKGGVEEVRSLRRKGKRTEGSPRLHMHAEQGGLAMGMGMPRARKRASLHRTVGPNLCTNPLTHYSARRPREDGMLGEAWRSAQPADNGNGSWGISNRHGMADPRQQLKSFYFSIKKGKRKRRGARALEAAGASLFCLPFPSLQKEERKTHILLEIPR